MHFGFALELTDIDLWNTDLLDTHLDFLSRDEYTDIPSNYFVCLHKIFKRSWRHVFKTSSRHVFKTNKCLLGSLWRRTSLPNPVETLGFINCYTSSRRRPVKSPSNSISCNYKKICSWLRAPENKPEIRKKATFL